MRVIAGSAKGRTLKGPPSHATRPMADKIKGALFNSLASLGIEPDIVLDLYAGTGSIGIEALSRGATRADFVEQSRDACHVIRENLTSTGFARIGTVHQAPVKAFMNGTRMSYDFVIMDPPYADPEIIPTLHALGVSPLVQFGSIVVIGHSPRVELPDQLGRLDRLRHRRHGDSCFSIYEVADATPDDGSEGDPSNREAEHVHDARDLSGQF